jgi:N-acetylglutamate synthase-like GNAT family acetyltransferase
MKIDISSDNKKLQINQIHEMLTNCYWSPGITANEILKGINNSSLSVGAYTDDGNQIGFLRVVSDKVRFAFIMDVVVNGDYRKQGIGRRMVNYILSHPELHDVYIWLLATNDAHGVYAKCGFKLLENPERWMSIRNPRPDRVIFAE